MKTTGELRDFLAQTMVSVRDAKLSPERASIVIKAAAQINESFYSEAKVKALEKSFGNAISDLGKLKIN